MRESERGEGKKKRGSKTGNELERLRPKEKERNQVKIRP